MSVRRLAYVVLRCADLERSRRFYELLGLQLVPEQHGKGSRHYSCEMGGVTLELYPLAGASTAGLRLGLVVSDLEGVLESMRAIGASIAGTGPGGMSSVTVVDPDGHQIALESSP